MQIRFWVLMVTICSWVLVATTCCMVAMERMALQAVLGTMHFMVEMEKTC